MARQDAGQKKDLIRMPRGLLSGGAMKVNILIIDFIDLAFNILWCGFFYFICFLLYRISAPTIQFTSL